MALAVVVIAVLSASLGGVLLFSGAHSAPSQASPALTTAPTATTSAPHTVSAPTPTAPGAAAEARLQAEIQANHINPHTIFPPNLLYAPQMKNGMIVHPGYPQAPEPAGLADYGILNSSGTPVSTSFDTSSYRASLGLNSVTPFYLGDGVPEGFTSQLNVVMKNVTLFGNSSYNFWAQNVLFYDAFSQQLVVENNIWNFSAPSAPQPVDTFLKIPGYTNGTDVASVGYYYVQTQTFIVPTPFTIVFYLNTTTHLYNGTAYPEVDFAFDLLNGAGVQTMSDMFDRVLFNNTGGGATVPTPMFHVDGTNLTPTGYIPYDAEIMLGGPGGGSTATFSAINGTMTLQHWDSTANAYVNEASAWSSGSETGETAVGIAEYYDANDVVHLGGGPEFIQPFWNSSATAAAGAATLTGTITPSNSWAFATVGSSYNISDSAWGPLPVSGPYWWNLTQATYTVKVMESDYDQVVSAPLALTAGTATDYSLTLVSDTSVGVYTPLYAWSNSQLAAISSGGSGTSADPYVLLNNEYTNLSGEFASMNDYAFPSYPGIELVGTSAYVAIENAAPFAVDFWGVTLHMAAIYDLPTSNSLSTWLFEDSNVSIVGGVYSGWFSSFQTGFTFANVVLWNTTSVLVGANTFLVSTVAIWTYGGTGNTFLGNSFLYEPVNGNVMIGVGCILPYGCVGLGITGLIENEGGDSIWNNYFNLPITAFEANYNVFDDLYPSVPFNYVNNWNLSAPIPASAVTTVNGFSFSGSVGNYPMACGNWWDDYTPGFTVLPYSESEAFGIPLITTGGDYCPAGSLASVVFAESGLPSGTAWSVSLAGEPTLSGSGPTLSSTLANGTYLYTVGTVTGYSASTTTGYAIVGANGAVTTVTITFTSTASRTGTISGLVTPSSATVWVDGTAVSVSSGAFSLTASVGVHSVEALASGYYPYYNNVTVGSGQTTSLTISMNPTTTPVGSNGTLNLAVTPATATAWVDGSAVTLTAGAYSASMTPGVHSIEVSATGYYTYYNNVTVVSSAATNVSIALNPVTAPPGPDGTLSLSVSTSGATVLVNGQAVTLTSGSYSVSTAPGVYSVVVSASGYYTYYNNVTVSSSKTTTVTVSLNSVSSGTSSSSNNGISNTAWILIGVLAALAVIFLITTVIYMGRSRGGSGSGPSGGGDSNP
jgi:thermopsin